MEGSLNAADAEALADGIDDTKVNTCNKMKKYSHLYSGPRYHCGCPIRTLPPEIPDVLPFDPIEENIGKMEEWIFSRYLSSSFNV